MNDGTPQKLECTFRSECGRSGCCGCVTLYWCCDESAYQAQCNECGAILGWAKEDWSSPDDRIRLGSDVPIR